jgi:hypothetical protein
VTSTLSSTTPSTALHWTSNPMASNNFIVGLAPAGQKRWFITPQVKIFESNTIALLELDVNDWIDSLALPITNSFKYNISSIEYTSAREANNIVSYSALIRYNVWEPQ